MDVGVIAALLLSLGVGGVIGAAAAAVLSATRVKAAFAAFETAFRTYLVGRSDPQSLEVLSLFETLDEEIDMSGKAFERLRRTLRRK